MQDRPVLRGVNPSSRRGVAGAARGRAEAGAFELQPHTELHFDLGARSSASSNLCGAERGGSRGCLMTGCKGCDGGWGGGGGGDGGVSECQLSAGLSHLPRGGEDTTLLNPVPGGELWHLL